MEAVAGSVRHDDCNDFTPAWLRIDSSKPTLSHYVQDQQVAKPASPSHHFHSRGRQASVEDNNSKHRVWSPKRPTITSSHHHFYPDYCSNSSSRKAPISNKVRYASSPGGEVAPENGYHIHAKPNVQYDFHPPNSGLTQSGPFSKRVFPSNGLGGRPQLLTHHVRSKDTVRPAFHRHGSFPLSSPSVEASRHPSSNNRTDKARGQKQEQGGVELTPDDFPSLSSTASPGPSVHNQSNAWAAPIKPANKHNTGSISSAASQNGIFRASIKGTKVIQYHKQAGVGGSLGVEDLVNPSERDPAAASSFNHGDGGEDDVFMERLMAGDMRPDKGDEVEPSEDEKRLLRIMGWKEDVNEKPLTPEEMNSFTKVYLKQRGFPSRGVNGSSRRFSLRSASPDSLASMCDSSNSSGAGSSHQSGGGSVAGSEVDEEEDEEILRLEVETLTTSTSAPHDQMSEQHQKMDAVMSEQHQKMDAVMSEQHQKMDAVMCEHQKMDAVMCEYADVYLRTVEERVVAEEDTSTTISDYDDSDGGE